YVADWAHGLRVFDVSDLAAPHELGDLELGAGPSSLARVGHTIYLGDSDVNGQLHVIDVSDPAHPHELGSAPAKGWDLDVAGTTVYTVDDSGDGGLHVWDVSNPAAPHEVGSYAQGACTGARGVAVVGTLVVIGCDREATVLDVSNPGAPQRLGATTVP